MLWHFAELPRDTDEYRQQTGWRAENLRKPGLRRPATLIDVGVAHGTPELYAAFPNAYLVLVEPVAEFGESIGRILEDRPGEHVAVAAGAADEAVTLHVNLDRPFITSIGAPAFHPSGTRIEEREVRTAKLDTLLAERAWQPPFGLKIDTEGSELGVVRGATALLRQTQFVIAEVSVARSGADGYEFSDFVAEMRAQDFHLCDIVDGQKIARGADAYILDAMFRRRS